VTADRHGIANSPGDTFDFHFTVDAPGYAPDHEYAGHSDIVDLVPGVVAEAVVLDALARPRADLAIECYLGCPHSPAVQVARTDENGFFRLEQASPAGTLWAPGPSSLEIGDVSDCVPWEGPREVLVVDRGLTATGRVVDGEGTPIAGCVVRMGSREYARGPATLTDAAGAFRLEGLAADAEITVVHPAHTADDPRWARYAAWSPQVPLRVTFPVPELDPSCLVSFESAPDATLTLTRLSDGFTVREEVFSHGGIDLDLVPGRYRAEVGLPFEAVHAPAREITVPEAPEATFAFPAEPRARLSLRLANPPRDMAAEQGVLRIEGHERWVKLATPGEVHLPAQADAVFWMHAGVWRGFRVGPLRDGRRAVDVRWPPPHRMRLPFEGRPGDLEVRPSRHRFDSEVRAHEAVLSTYARGTVKGTVRLGDGLGWRRFRVALLEEPGAEVRLGRADLEVGPSPRIRVLRADGTPAVEALIHLQPDWGSLTTGGDGVAQADWRGEADPTYALVEVDGHLPLYVPWAPDLEEVRMPSGWLELTVTSEDGSPLDAVACLGGWLGRTEAGGLRVGGIEPGLHTLVVGARGHEGRRLRIVVPENEPKRVSLSLPRRNVR
jgi:hypothetical protein